MTTGESRPTFLLVHGAYHTSTTWRHLQRELSAGGWKSEVIDMPSAGKHDGPDAGLYDDAEALAERLRGMDGPVVVVGHSHAGLTITELGGGHPNLVRLVYLAAFMPTEGESAGSLSGIPIPEVQAGPAPAMPDPRTALYGDLSDDEAADEITRLVDQSLLSCCQPTTRASWRTVPSTYVLCEQDQAMSPAAQETFALRATSIERVKSGHSPQLSAPDRLAALLARIATVAMAERG
ncbi:alpha/beta hydrolase [Streptomyces sp. Lzd4kr]|nr:alpha/beta hydrolase [Streptomyces sp. Lzd4kr]